MKVKFFLPILFCLCFNFLEITRAAPITSPFGWRIHPISGQWAFHTGVDIGYEEGTEIVALRSGTVVYAAPYGGYGNCVIIEDSAGDHQLYAHSSRILCSYGQDIAQNQVIALVGSTGNSTGPHLHVEYWKNSQYVNPLELWE
jgi:murein DD-endopeptidase MepM/ murein hydrolase activator NlpD